MGEVEERPRCAPLACHPMAKSRLVIAVLIIDASIEAKIKEKHNLTPAEVREAVLLDPDVQAEWLPPDEEHPRRRLKVAGTTYLARLVIAYLLPANEYDENEGTFVLMTALSET